MAWKLVLEREHFLKYFSLFESPPNSLDDSTSFVFGIGEKVIWENFHFYQYKVKYLTRHWIKMKRIFFRYDNRRYLWQQIDPIFIIQDKIKFYYSNALMFWSIYVTRKKIELWESNTLILRVINNYNYYCNNLFEIYGINTIIMKKECSSVQKCLQSNNHVSLLFRILEISYNNLFHTIYTHNDVQQYIHRIHPM